MPPLRRPREGELQPRTPPPRNPSPAPEWSELTEVPELDVKPIKPNFVRYAPERSPEDCRGDDDEARPAPNSVVPRLARPEYYSKPSIEAMSHMSEARLGRIDNLEVGRYGYGCVKWPGLTDVRRMDFDDIVSIDRSSLTLYPDQEKPKVGEGLNKEAVITLNVKPSRTVSSGRCPDPEVLKARLAKISEDFGGRFIDYDMERWIFLVPHFNGVGGDSKTSTETR